MIFNGCKFKENFCNSCSGGVFYIMTNKPLTITNAMLKISKAHQFMLIHSSDIVQIRDSTFEGRCSIGGTWIYSTIRTINFVIPDIDSALTVYLCYISKHLHSASNHLISFSALIQLPNVVVLNLIERLMQHFQRIHLPISWYRL